MVMATAIVSVALLREGYLALSNVLLVVAALEYVALAILLVPRRASWHPLSDPASAFGAFTFVAASTLLGERFHELGWWQLGWALIAVGVLAWLLIAYAVPAVIILERGKPPAVTLIDGSWLLWVVATEAVATGTSAAAVSDPGLQWLLAPAAVASWSIGVLLYLIVITILMGRLLLLELGGSPPAPTYWINMGATAIVTLAGARILALPRSLPVIAFESSAVGAISFLLWSFGTYLIPLLLLLAVWRHSWRVLARYDVAFWSLVFPLGMYSVASLEFGTATHLHFMEVIGRAMLWPAVAAWLATAALGLRLLTSPKHVHERGR